ncbi:Gag-Pol poly [Paramuricea clavata]|uniref:Gag-Pol poly n=1 Tax=Paramuricea clavata TaxID=317549 RepID=A0A7D9LII6_PARCT|nr:Gag-Pol poly [Paramuricea clavata]
MSFDGNPLDYPSFITNFKTNVEDVESDPNVRRTYLTQLRTGKAKEAISGSVKLPPEEGYKKAKSILHEMSGQAHIVAASHIDRVTKDINSRHNISAIVLRLPKYLRSEWAKEANKLRDQSSEPDFAALTEFVVSKAKLANTECGRLVNVKMDWERDKTKSYGKPQRNVSAYQVWNISSNEEQDGKRNITMKLKCIFCSKEGHSLGRCYMFQEKSYAERKKFVSEKGLCNLCLAKGHFASKCQKGPDIAKRQVCLRVIPVKVSSRDNSREKITYAIRHEGSNTTLVKESLVNELGLEGRPLDFKLTTMNKFSQESGKSHFLYVQGLGQKDCLEIPNALSIKGDSFYWPDVPEAHWKMEERRGRKKEPYAIRTPLGLSVAGPMATTSESEFSAFFVREEDEFLGRTVEKMFEMDFSESTYGQSLVMSSEDKKPLSIMEESLIVVDSHYQLDLSFRDKLGFPNNRGLAERRLNSLKARPKKDSDLHENIRRESTTTSTRAMLPRSTKVKGIVWLNRFIKYLRVRNSNGASYKDDETQAYISTRSRDEVAGAGVGPLTVDDLQNARKQLIRYVQQEAFPDEITRLKRRSSGHLPRKSL